MIIVFQIIVRADGDIYSKDFSQWFYQELPLSYALQNDCQLCLQNNSTLYQCPRMFVKLGPMEVGFTAPYTSV